MVELGNARKVSVRFGRMLFIAWIELNHVARPVECTLLLPLNTVLNTVSVYLSIRLSVSYLSEQEDKSTSTDAIF